MVALANLALKRKAKALQAVNAAVEIDPHRTASLNIQGIVLLKCGHHRQAETALRSSLSIDPTSAQAWSNLGAALIGQRRRRDAIAPLQHALEIDPTLRVSVRNLRLAASGFPFAGRRLEAAAAVGVAAATIFIFPATAFVLIAVILIAGWYRRHTWFRGFSPIARSHLFNRRNQYLAFTGMVVAGCMGALAGAIVGLAVAAATGDPTTDRGSGIIVTGTLLGVGIGVWVGTRLFGKRLKDSSP